MPNSHSLILLLFPLLFPGRVTIEFSFGGKRSNLARLFSTPFLFCSPPLRETPALARKTHPLATPRVPAMPPKRKSPAAAGASPRKTRSMAAGKQREEAPAKVAKKAAAAPEQKGKKRAKKEDGEAAAAVEKKKNTGAVASDGKRVIVEACTQCRQFKIRAMKVKEDLESAVPGVSVLINPEKPRRGCLEIREEGGEVFISLLVILLTTFWFQNHGLLFTTSICS
ncbi:hypothetical protein GUJ93_ZPchr0011g27469 [Zizania palustris]|uniref:Selenoprotein H n=1 Tax=Zizania palustris TaxID=103762 RepID=A0A8J5WFX0_ZIZPA|nr:hypothetical protein GUJ93_ZPchr0011g27469 [Zizania palustris]